MLKKSVSLVLSATLNGCGLVLALTAVSGMALAVDNPAVPEMNPASMASAITLIVGGAFVLTDKLRGR